MPLFRELEEKEQTPDYIQQLIKEIESIDIATMTPIDAIVFLNQLKTKIKQFKN